MFTIWRRRQTRAWLLDFPSDIFLLKYALARSLPILDICESAILWKAQFSLRLPLLLLTWRVFLPLERSLGEQPAYLDKAPGEVNLVMSPISPMMVEAMTTPQPEAVWIVYSPSVNNLSISFSRSTTSVWISKSLLIFLFIVFKRYGSHFGFAFDQNLRALMENGSLNFCSYSVL